MKIQMIGAAKRLILSLLLSAGLGGCAIYDAPYGAYDSYPYGYGNSTYFGPPISVDLGFGFYDYGGGYYRGHRGQHFGRGGYHGQRGHNFSQRGFHPGSRGHDRRH